LNIIYIKSIHLYISSIDFKIKSILFNLLLGIRKFNFHQKSCNKISSCNCIAFYFPGASLPLENRYLNYSGDFYPQFSGGLRRSCSQFGVDPLPL